MMETMYQERRAAGLEVVGIALSGALADAAAFGQAVGITYPLAVDPSTAVDYEVVALPTHFWIDRDGIVRAWASGDAPPDVFEEKLARIVGSGQ